MKSVSQRKVWGQAWESAVLDAGFSIPTCAVVFKLTALGMNITSLFIEIPPIVAA